VPLLEEIWICTQRMQNMSYADVLAMPTYERRFFIGQLTRDVMQKQEHFEKMQEQQKTQGTKGQRSTRVSGEALKSQIKSGNIPTT
jgi:hypothetical protein